MPPMKGYVHSCGRLYAWYVPVMGELLCGFADSVPHANHRISIAIARYLNTGEVTSLLTSKTVH